MTAVAREPERLLLQAALVSPSSDAARALAAGLVAGPLDVPRLVAAARMHGLSGLVRCLVRDLPVPAALREALAADAREAVAHAAWARAAAREVLAALGSRGLRPVVLKGPALAERFYDPPDLREYVDLDLLVAPEETPAYERALEAIGYRPKQPAPPGRPDAAIRWRGEAAFRHERLLEVDLHWSLRQRCFPLDWPVGEVLARAREVATRDGTLRTLDADDQVLYLCVHGAKDAWRRWIWIADLGRALAAEPPRDAGRLVRRARRAGALRALALGLHLARFAGEAPDDPGLARLAAWGPARALGRRVRLAPLERAGLEPAGRAAYGAALRLRERPRDRARRVADDLFAPTVEDLAAWPAAVAPLGRPLRWTARRMGRRLRS